MSEIKTYKARVDDIIRYGDDKAVLRLKFGQSFPYQAGQYVLLSFDEFDARPYSIANAPGADHIEIHIKDNGRGGFSSFAVKSLTCGEIVNVSASQGTCVYQKTERKIILIAGGMGIAPLKAIAEEAVRCNHAAGIHLYWGARTMDDIYMDAELSELSNMYPSFVYSRFIGQDIGAYLIDVENDFSEADIYLSGPFEMIHAVAPQIINKGAAIDRIYTDQHDALRAIKS